LLHSTAGRHDRILWTISPEYAIQLVQTDSLALTAGLNGLRDMLFNAAEANVTNAVGDDLSAYTALQMRAMVAAEALRMTTGLDLSTVLTRGDIIRQIETEGLAAVHPNGYANLTALAEANNVSVGELSDIRSLCDVIFPYIQGTLERNLYEVWEQIGKSRPARIGPRPARPDHRTRPQARQCSERRAANARQRRRRIDK
jgi:hypothetical protein